VCVVVFTGIAVHLEVKVIAVVARGPPADVPVSYKASVAALTVRVASAIVSTSIVACPPVNPVVRLTRVLFGAYAI
jgi:hypothetical protein